MPIRGAASLQHCSSAVEGVAPESSTRIAQSPITHNSRSMTNRCERRAPQPRDLIFPLTGKHHVTIQVSARQTAMTCRPSRIANSIFSPDSCRFRSGTGAPWLASPSPGSCKPLRHQLIANGAPRTVQDSKCAAVTILAFTGDLEATCIQKLHQPVPRP